MTRFLRHVWFEWTCCTTQCDNRGASFAHQEPCWAWYSIVISLRKCWHSCHQFHRMVSSGRVSQSNVSLWEKIELIIRNLRGLFSNRLINRLETYYHLCQDWLVEHDAPLDFKFHGLAITLARWSKIMGLKNKICSMTLAHHRLACAWALRR